MDKKKKQLKSILNRYDMLDKDRNFISKLIKEEDEHLHIQINSKIINDTLYKEPQDLTSEEMSVAMLINTFKEESIHSLFSPLIYTHVVHIDKPIKVGNKYTVNGVPGRNMAYYGQRLFKYEIIYPFNKTVGGALPYTVINGVNIGTKSEWGIILFNKVIQFKPLGDYNMLDGSNFECEVIAIEDINIFE